MNTNSLPLSLIPASASAIIALAAAYFSYNQVVLQRTNADRVWRAQLISTLFEAESCNDAASRETRHCPPKASRRSREEALKDLVQLERKYHRKMNLRDIDITDLVLVSEDFSDVELPDAHLQRANLNGSNWRNSMLVDAQLQGASFEGASFENADFSGANLHRAHLSGAKLRNATFLQADLGSCGDVQIDLATGEFHAGTDLTNTDLSGVDFSHANFCGTTIRGADLRGADLSEANKLEQWQLDVAKGDKTTRIPANLRRPDSWK